VLVAWSAEDIPDLTGQIAVVTGANGGLGLETARELARKGAHVVMAARDQEKVARAEADIRSDVGSPSLEIVPLDLGSLESVREAAGRMLESHERIDILMNNAGVMGLPERRTADGFEMQLGVNHLGHWALTARLMPALLRAPAARVVSVTSTAHHLGRAVNPDNPHLEGRYGPWRAYYNSKLANFHFGLGLERRLREAGVPAASLLAHPGLTNSDLQAHAARENSGDAWARFWNRAASTTGMSEPRGALSQLRAATDPEARGGELYGPLWVNSGPPVRKPIFRRIGLGSAIDKLWQVSERETGERLAVRAPG
jgi:NAD(P)-dependent dehydrogenase (short-subunit alcohol dehydrogenase family)